MLQKNEVLSVLSSVVNNIHKIYNPDVLKSVLHGIYRTVGTFDVRDQNAINIHNYIYIYEIYILLPRQQFDVVRCIFSSSCYVMSQYTELLATNLGLARQLLFAKTNVHTLEDQIEELKLETSNLNLM